MNYLIPSLRTIPKFSYLRPIQQFIATHPIICALGAIGMIATVTAYYNATQNVPPPLAQVQTTQQLITKAQDLIAFYNALPARLNKPQIQGESIITQAVFVKHWMQNEGSYAIKNCRELDLSGKQLTTVPPEIGLFGALKVLNLSHNRLTTIPPEIIQIKALANLDLSHNQFATFPSEIIQHKALRTLNLSNNRLFAIPPEIGQIKALVNLDLSHNQLTALPLQIKQFQTLVNLDLSHNQFTAIPDFILNLPSNCKVNAENNSFTPVFLQSFKKRLHDCRDQGPNVFLPISEDINEAQPRRLGTTLLKLSQRDGK